MQRFYIIDSMECLYPLEGITWEAVYLKSGKFLCVVSRAENNTKKEMEALPGVIALPGLLSRNTIKPEHAAHLKEFGVHEEHTTFEAMEEISKVWPQFQIKLY